MKKPLLSARFAGLGVLLICLLPAGVLANTDESNSPQSEAVSESQLKFFESRIRPVLVQHCYSCHSSESDSVKGGLLLDSREAILSGGDSGPALVPTKPDESLLLQAMKHESLEMPPDRRLPPEVLADFETWIQNGAADPRTGGSVKTRHSVDIDAGREFWSFRPVIKPPIPAAGENWAGNFVDRFIADGHANASGLTAIRESDQRAIQHAISQEVPPSVLLRRLTFVLTGLPPTLEEQREFVSAFEQNPDVAMEAVVDRLLASPRFGERWGRHWLDVARYAESTGGGRSMMLPDAWRFRDYVIRSFNADKPFDQLVREHLAGDLLPSDSDSQLDEQLTGVGYLMLGAINYEEQDKEQLRMDVVDEQIDSMGRTFLGMTLGCCRCHDHKFDPIPTSDYYALAGIFRSTKSLTPGNVCGFVTAPLRSGVDTKVLEKWTKDDQELAKQIASLKAAIAGRPGQGSEARPGVGSLGVLEGVVVDDSEADFEGEWTSSMFQQPYFGSGYQHSGHGPGRTGISAKYEAALPADGEYLIRMVINHAESRSERIPVLIEHADGESIVFANQRLKPPGDGVFAELGRFRFESSQKARLTVKAFEASPGYVIADAVQFVPASVTATGTPNTVTPAVAQRTPNSVPVADVAQMQKELDRLVEQRKTHEKLKPQIPVVMCVEEEKSPGNWHVHIRGEIRNLGPKVPRGFLRVASPPELQQESAAKISESASGRRELADWVASEQNPLTARVYVNRVWAHVMGEGLVRTPDNFGETGERPTHPELLDYLAAVFMEEGWSTKKLIRHLCLSRTFRMSSSVPNGVQQNDPDNRLLTRAFRRRIDAESLRDSLLKLSGNLDLNVTSGPTIVKLSTYDNEYRHSMYPTNARSVFVPAFRNTMLDLFEIFDGANPNLVTGKRTRSTRPAQSLYLLNSPFVMEQATQAARGFLKSAHFSSGNPEISLQNVWRICLCREATNEEIGAVLPIVGEDPTSVEAWTEVFHALFASVDFRYLE